MAAPNGNTTAFGYDDLGRPSAKTTTGSGGVSRAAYSWTPNRAGAVTAESSTISGDPTNGPTSYTYDPLGRLTGFTRSGTTTSYGWQAVPNRSSVQVGVNPATTTTFDDANRPTADSAGGAYTSDADGRLTVRPGQRLEWDTLGRLTKVKPPSGNNAISTYTYDPLDRLLLVDHGGSDRIRLRYVGLTTSIAQLVDDQTGAVIRSIGNSWTGEPVSDWTGSGSNLRVFGGNGHHDLTWTADAHGRRHGHAALRPVGHAHELDRELAARPPLPEPVPRPGHRPFLVRQPLVRVLPRPLRVRGLAPRRAGLTTLPPPLRLRRGRADRTMGSERDVSRTRICRGCNSGAWLAGCGCSGSVVRGNDHRHRRCWRGRDGNRGRAIRSIRTSIFAGHADLEVGLWVYRRRLALHSRGNRHWLLCDAPKLDASVRNYW